MSSWNFRLATLAVTAVILHGSLYPYDFRVPAGGFSPVAVLLHSWNEPPSGFGDLIANILLYVPFGFFGGLATRGGWVRRFWLMTLTGLVLCTGVELAQFYDSGRVTNMSDVYLNTFGTSLGAVAALLFGGIRHYPPLARIAAKPAPVLLLVAMLGYHLFPYVPTIDLHKYWHSVQPLIHAPQVLPGLVLRYGALWLTTSCLIGELVGYQTSLLLVPLFIGFVFACKIAIVSLVVTRPEVIGAASAFALWAVAGNRWRVATLFAAVVLFVSIGVGRLEPFDFQATARGFGWLPFKSFLGGSISVNTDSFLEKFFLYGSLVWLLAETGFRYLLATPLTAALLFLTSLAETYLPGRSAEITDALMALMIGAIIAALHGFGAESRKSIDLRPQNRPRHS